MTPSKLLLVIVAAVTGLLSCKKASVENPGDASPPISDRGEGQWIVSTIAGNGDGSFINGPALSATFHFPEDITIVGDDMIYVTDAVNSVVRELRTDRVSTFAGSGSFGIADGTDQTARFRYPFSITSDAIGNLYSTDENDPRIRMVSPSGDVITYAGDGTPGFADGDAKSARLTSGNYLVAGAGGSLFIADGNNHRIRHISLSGQVSTLAGTGAPGFKDGHATVAQFNSPGGIAVDKEGNLYVVDRGNFRIRKITSAGEVTTIAGSGIAGDLDGSAADAQFSLDTRDIVVDEYGNLYLSDRDRIREISKDGVVSTIAGSAAGYEDGIGHLAKFNFPNGLGLDSRGNIYVADLNNNRVRQIRFQPSHGR